MGTSINAATIQVDTEPLIQAMERSVDALNRASAEFGKLSASAKEASSHLDDVQQHAKESGRTMEDLAENVTKMVAGFATFEAVKEVFNKVLEAGIELENAQHRLAGVFAATGGSVGYTLEQLTQKAEQLSKTSLFDDKQARNAEAALMAFSTIHGQTFDRALKDSADLASLMGGDLVSSARMLGRALEDPERGLQMLRRSGVAFTESQRQMITDLARSGDLFGAQGAILQIVEGKVAGLAETMHTGLEGRLKDLKEAWTDAWEGMSQSSFFQTVVAKVAEFATNVGHALAYITEGAGAPAQRRAALVAYRDIVGQSLDTPQRAALMQAQSELNAGKIPSANADLPHGFLGVLNTVIAKMEQEQAGVGNAVKLFSDKGFTGVSATTQGLYTNAFANAPRSMQDALHATTAAGRAPALDAIRQAHQADVDRQKDEFKEQIRSALNTTLKYDEGSSTVGWVLEALPDEIKKAVEHYQEVRNKSLFQKLHDAAGIKGGPNNDVQQARDQVADAVKKFVGKGGFDEGGGLSSARAEGSGYTAGLNNIADQQEAILNQVSEERARQQINEFGAKTLAIETELLQAALSPEKFNSPEVQRYLDERKVALVHPSAELQHKSRPELLQMASQAANQFYARSQDKSTAEEMKARIAASKELTDSLRAEIYGYTSTKEELEAYTQKLKENRAESRVLSQTQQEDLQRLARIARDTYGPISDLVDQTNEKITSLTKGASAGEVQAVQDRGKKLLDEYRKNGVSRSSLATQEESDQNALPGARASKDVQRVQLLVTDLQRIQGQKKDLDDADLRNQLEYNQARVKDAEATSKLIEDAAKVELESIKARQDAGALSAGGARAETIQVQTQQRDAQRQYIQDLIAAANAEKSLTGGVSPDTRLQLVQAIGQLEKYNLDLAKTSDALYDMRTAAKSAIEDGVSKMMDDLLTKATHAKDAIKNMFHEVVRGIEQKLLDAVFKEAMKPLDDMLNKLLGIKPPEEALKESSALLAASSALINDASGNFSDAAKALADALLADKPAGGNLGRLPGIRVTPGDSGMTTSGGLPGLGNSLVDTPGSQSSNQILTDAAAKGAFDILLTQLPPQQRAAVQTAVGIFKTFGDIFNGTITGSTDNTTGGGDVSVLKTIGSVVGIGGKVQSAVKDVSSASAGTSLTSAGTALLGAAAALKAAAASLSSVGGAAGGFGISGIDPFGGGIDLGGFSDGVGGTIGLLSGGDTAAGIAASGAANASRLAPGGRLLASRGVAGAGVTHVLHVVVPVNVSALDGPSAVEALKVHAPVIQDMAIQGIMRSTAMARVVARQARQ